MPIARFEMPDGRIARFEVPEGTSPEQAQTLMQDYMATQSPKPDTGDDGFDFGAALQGASDFGSYGFGDEAIAALTAGGATALDLIGLDTLLGGELDKSFGEIYSEQLDKRRGELKEAQERSPVSYMTGGVGGALLTGAGGLKTKGGQSLAKSLSQGGLLSRATKGAGAGAVSGGVAGFGIGEGGAGERLESALPAAGLGFVGGGAIPLAGATLRGAKSVVAPKIKESVKPLAKRAADFNIPLSIDQLSPTKFRQAFQKVSQDMPFSGVDDFIDAQRQAWNKAVAKTIGVDDLGPAGIKQFKKNADKEFGVLAKDKVIEPTSDFAIKLQAIVDDAYEGMGDEIGGIVERKAKKIFNTMAKDEVQGSAVAAVRSGLVRKKVKSDAAEHIGDIVSLLDEQIAPVLTTAERATLAATRRKYRNFKTIEPLLEKSTDGTINPSALQSRVAASRFIKASEAEVGEDELVDLGRIGKDLLPKLGGSDTQARQMASYVTGGGLASTGAAMATGSLTPAIIGGVFAGGSIGVNRAFQKLVNQNPKRVDKLVNHGQKTGNFKPLVRAVNRLSGGEKANENAVSNQIKRLLKDERGGVGGTQAERMARAKAQGFDVDNPVYHGTGASFKKFKPSKTGVYGKGVYFGGKKAASEYARDEGGNVVQAVLKKGKYATESDLDRAIEEARKLGFKRTTAVDKASDILKSKGFLGIKDADTTVVFDPKNIRSVNAQFDPAKASSSDLLAMRAPIAMAGGGAIAAAANPNNAQANPFEAFDEYQKNMKKEVEKAQNKQQAGTNTPYYEQVAQVESTDNYNALNKDTKAFGKYQFIPSTAEAFVKKYGDSIGVTMDNWKEPANQEKLVRVLTEENRANLASFLKREPTAGEMYVAHFLGAGTGRKMLNPKNNRKKGIMLVPKKIRDKVAKANKTIFFETDDKGKPIRTRSAFEVREILKKKMEN